MKNWTAINWITIIFNAIVLGINITALCHSFPNNQNLGFDYSGLLVGILSLLVTTLIAW